MEITQALWKRFTAIYCITWHQAFSRSSKYEGANTEFWHKEKTLCGDPGLGNTLLFFYCEARLS